jgi:CheY-like chemotaxis protein
VTEDIKGVRAIVVEDDPLICLLIEDMLADLGCKVVGTACDFERATELAQCDESVDIAILDVNLGGQLVFPVADILSRRGIALLFATGMGAGGRPWWCAARSTPKLAGGRLLPADARAPRREAGRERNKSQCLEAGAALATFSVGDQPPPSAWNRATAALSRSSCTATNEFSAWNNVCSVCSKVTRFTVPSRSCCSER